MDIIGRLVEVGSFLVNEESVTGMVVTVPRKELQSLGGLPLYRNVAVLAWYTAEEFPDDAERVIVGFDDGDTEHGYWDSESAVWRSMENLPFSAPVIAWCQCPAVPRSHEN